MDHVDYFHSMEQIRKSFSAFAALTGKDGYAVANTDDGDVRLVMNGYEGNVVTFGVESEADFTAHNIKYIKGRPDFDIYHNGKPYSHVSLSVTGEHNVYNALAATAAAYVCGIDGERSAKGLASYRGAKRRMEYKGTLCGADVYDDYGHHPTEVKTTLDGVSRMGYDRVWCVFQSHTYSRTSELFDEFIHSFDSADRVIFADIYAARETDTRGMSGAVLADALGSKAAYVGGNSEIAALLHRELREGDVLIVMGAGDIYKLYGELDIKNGACPK